MGVRVWELAAQAGQPVARVLEVVARHAPEVTSHLSAVTDDIAASITNDLDELASGTSLRDTGSSPFAAPAGRTPRRQSPQQSSGQSQERPLRRRPGPARVTAERPWEPDPYDDDHYIDPRDALRYQQTLSTRDLATVLGITPATVRKWVARGHLTSAGTSGPSAMFDTRSALAAAARVAGRRRHLADPAGSAGPAGPAETTPRPASPGPGPAEAGNTGPPRASAAELHRMERVYPHLVLTTADAATLLGLKPATIRSWTRRGHLHPAPGSNPRQHTYRLSDLIAVRGHGH